jgi:hypothetical protein
LLSPFITVFANIGIDSKYLMENDDGGGMSGLRSSDIGAKLAASAVDSDSILHRIGLTSV